MGVNEDKYDSGQAPHHLERLLHHQLPGPGRQGRQRQLRHQARADDDDPRLHQRPEHPGPAAQGPAPRPRRRPEHDPDHHRRGQGRRPGHPGAEGQVRRHLPCACPRPPCRWSTSWPSSRSRRTTDELLAAFDEAAAEGPMKGILGVSRRAAGVDGLQGRRRSSHRRRRVRRMVMDGTMVKVVTWYDNEWGYSVPHRRPDQV